MSTSLNLAFGPAWPACTSALQLDRLALGELVAEEADALRDHLEACTRCSAAAASLEQQRGEALPPLRALVNRPPALKLVPPAVKPEAAVAKGPPLAAPAPLRSRFVAISVLGAFAAAAVVFLVARPAEYDGAARLKGRPVELVMFVKHGEQVRRALPHEVVEKGDAVRFAFDSASGGYAAVLSLDPRGQASVYYPVGARAAQLAAGFQVALPIATRLDDSVGVERLLGIICSAPVELEPVRSKLQAGDGELLPEGCEASQWSFVKR